MMSQHQMCTFYLDRYYFGIDVLSIQEVMCYQEMTPVPLAPPAVRGLINLRGQVVMALDLRPGLELPERPPDQRPMNIVVRTDAGVMSLLVDEIGDVVEVDERSFAPPPESMQGRVRELIRGAYKLEDRLLLIFDASKAVQMKGAQETITASPSL